MTTRHRLACGPLPEPAALAHLIRAYHASGRASTVLSIGGWQVQVTLARLRTTFINDDTGLTVARVAQIKGAQGINRPWMRGIAARLGMHDCGEPEHLASVWHIRGMLVQESESAA